MQLLFHPRNLWEWKDRVSYSHVHCLVVRCVVMWEGGRGGGVLKANYFPISHLTQVPNLEQRSPDGSFVVISVQTDPRVSVVVDVNAVFTIQNLNSSQDNGSVWRCSFNIQMSPDATLTVQSEFIYYASECIPTFLEFTTFFFHVLALLHICT